MSFGETLINTALDKLVIGLIIAIFAFRFNRLLEKFKRIQSEQLEKFKTDLLGDVEITRLTREALRKLAEKMGAAIHSISWVTWTAKYAPESLDPAMLASYDEELHTHLSEIVGARVSLATLNSKAHEQVSERIRQIYNLDHRISLAKADYAKDRKVCCKRLAAFHDEVLAFDKGTIDLMSTISLKR